jgi:hypothetical protein
MKFYYLETKFTSGKYKGQTLEEVFDKDPEYIDACLREDDNFLVTEEVMDELQNIKPDYDFSDDAIDRRNEKEKEFDSTADDEDEDFDYDEDDDRFADDDDLGFDEEDFDLEDLEDIDEEELDYYDDDFDDDAEDDYGDYSDDTWDRF